MIALSMRELELLIIIGCAVVAILSNRVRPDLMGPGSYTFGDFLRVGLGMTLVCFVTLLIVMPLL